MSKSQMTITGRIVWTLAPSNNPMERVVSKNKQTGQVFLDKTGQPVQQTVFSLAVPKGSPQLKQLEELKQLETLKFFPSGMVPKTFAHKIVDGDTDIDDKGKPYSLRDGHAGHMIIAFSARFAVSWYSFDGTNYNEINTGVKTGDFVDVNFTIAAHGPTQNGGVPGMYMEPKQILFRGVGDAIEKKVQAADPAKAFGNPGSPSPAQTFQQQQYQQQAPQVQQPQQFAQPAQPQFQPQVQQPQYQQSVAQPQQQAQWGQPQMNQGQQAAPAQPAQQPQPYHQGLPPQFHK